MYFSSPTSNITPALASVVMSRTDSRDSTCSGIYSSRSATSAYASLALSTSPAWSVSQTMSRTSSTSSSIVSNNTLIQSRRDSDSSNSSSTTWGRSPFRSCLETSCNNQASSYLSDDDLLFLAPPSSLQIESVPSISKPKQEMTTEEQIAMYRELQEKEEAATQHLYQQAERRRVVRFANETQSRRSSSSNQKKRLITLRKSSHQLNGPQ